MRAMLRQMKRFACDERASLTVEAILILPLLLWGYFGLFILFDGYRALGNNVRAAFTISDLLSRETEEVNAAYIEGLNDIQDVLTQSPHRTVLRVTAVRAVDANLNSQIDAGEHEFVWSYATAGKNEITEATLDSHIVDYLPVMHDGEFLLVVETWMAFVPFLNPDLRPFYCGAQNMDIEADIGPTCNKSESIFGPFYFESLVATRPRFAGQVCFEGGTGCGAS